MANADVGITDFEFEKRAHRAPTLVAESEPSRLVHQCLVGLDMLRESDTKETENLFIDTAVRAIQNMSLPMKSETFYFGDRDFYN